MLNDSGIEIEDEFLEAFIKDSQELLEDMKKHISSFHSIDDTHCFEIFGQKVDRIMGAAYTLSLNDIGDLARYGKEIGYKGSQLDDINKLHVIHSLLSQIQKSLESIFKKLRKGIRSDIEELSPLFNRLKSANLNLGELRSSVST